MYAAYMSDWGPVFVKCGVLYIYSVNFNVQLPLGLASDPDPSISFRTCVKS